MLSIGIDVSKGKSTVCGMKPGGEIVYTPFEIQHTREGMSELVSLLHNSCEEVRVVLESTGSYHCPVVAALLENGIFVSVVNSLVTLLEDHRQGLVVSSPRWLFPVLR